MRGGGAGQGDELHREYRAALERVERAGASWPSDRDDETLEMIKRYYEASPEPGGMLSFPHRSSDQVFTSNEIDALHQIDICKIGFINESCYKIKSFLRFSKMKIIGKGFDKT